MDTKLDIRLAQRLIMTPQLQQAIKLLQLSKLELQQLIDQTLLENPVLEENISETAETDEGDTQKDDTYKSLQVSDGNNNREDDRSEGVTPLDGINLKWGDYFDEDGFDRKELGYYYTDTDEESSTFEQILSKPSSLYDHLLWQLNLSTSDQQIREIGEVIIGNIDENGYLQATLEEIEKMSGAPEDKVLGVLRLIQGFDPSGVAARDLRECLLIQIAQLGFKGTIIESIVAEHLSDFEKKHFPVISKKLGITIEDLAHSIRIIERLEPKPGRPFYYSDNFYIVPDVFVIKYEGEYIIILNEEGVPRLRINPIYKKMLKKSSGIREDERNYLEDKFRSAIWMIRSIEQRNRTIYKVVQSIINFQMDFLEKGVGYLKPLTLREIADEILMHESTVSRVTHNKYVCTPQGIFELKYFFSSGIAMADGDSCSSRSVRNMINRLVSEENPKKPYSDQQIMESLRGNKIEIARRTVAKYRKELKIPSASRRRRLVI